MQFLSGFSLVALLVVVAIVLTGSLKQSETLLGPAGNGAVSSLLQTPVGQASTIVDHQIFDVLYEDARTDTIGGPITTTQLVADMQQSEPQYKVDAPGSVSARVLGPDFLFCAHAYSGFTCAAGNMIYGALSFAAGNTLAQAQDVAIATQKATLPAAAAPNTSAGAGNAVLRKARRLSGATGAS